LRCVRRMSSRPGFAASESIEKVGQQGHRMAGDTLAIHLGRT
jgi:hypothetical protein